MSDLQVAKSANFLIVGGHRGRFGLTPNVWPDVRVKTAVGVFPGVLLPLK